MDVNDFSQMGFLVPIITGLIAVVRGFGIPKKYRPVLALVIGVALAYFYLGSLDLKHQILAGIVMGLSSVGLHSGTKNISEGLSQRKETK